MPDAKEDPEALFRRAVAGNNDALVALWELHRNRLHQMVRLRLDPRLLKRVEASDVLQDTYIDLARCFTEYATRWQSSPYLLLRLMTCRRLDQIHRYHLGTAARDAGREVSLHRGALPQASSVSLAELLMGKSTTPSQAAVRAEKQVLLQAALNQMDPIDREVLALRHFEDLSNGEVAEVLELTKTAANNRYVRALVRLRKTLEAIPGFLDAT